MSSLPITTEHTLTLDEAVGGRVHQLLFLRKLKQQDLADVLGVDQGAIARRLRGKTKWTLEELSATALFLETTIAYLTGELSSPEVPRIGFEPMAFCSNGGLLEPPIDPRPLARLADHPLRQSSDLQYEDGRFTSQDQA